jgi:beta-mannosidase
MTRKEIKNFSNELSAAEFIVETLLDVWGTNSTLEEKEAMLEIRVFDLELDEDCLRETWTELIVLPPNSSTELWRGKLPGQPDRTRESEVPRPLVVSARLLVGEMVLARSCNW